MDSIPVLIYGERGAKLRVSEVGGEVLLREIKCPFENFQSANNNRLGASR